MAVINIITVVVDFMFGIISKAIGTFLSPVVRLFFENILGIDNWFDIAQGLLNNFVYPGVRFGRDVLINVTGMSPQLLSSIVVILGFMFAIWFQLLMMRFLINAWALFRTGTSISHVGGKK